VTLGFGYVLGFRVQTSVVAAVTGCLVLMAFAFAMCWLSALLGVLVKSAQGVQLWGFLFMFPLVFGSDILTPTKTMPGWLQAFVNVNPVTYLTDAERALLNRRPCRHRRGALPAVGGRHLRGLRTARRRRLPPPHVTGCHRFRSGAGLNRAD